MASKAKAKGAGTRKKSAGRVENSQSGEGRWAERKTAPGDAIFADMGRQPYAPAHHGAAAARPSSANAAHSAAAHSQRPRTAEAIRHAAYADNRPKLNARLQVRKLTHGRVTGVATLRSPLNTTTTPPLPHPTHSPMRARLIVRT